MVCDPGRVSAGEVIQFLKRATKASVKQGEPLGGVKQIIDTLADVTRRQGGEIHVSESAMEILTEGRTAVGVRTHVAAYRARAIVFAAPLFRLFTLIREDLFSREFANYVKGIKSSRGLTIDFVSREPLADIQGGIVGVEVPLWVKFQSNADPSLCPQGSHVCTWGLLFDPDEELTTASVERTEAHIKRIVEEVFPGALAKVIQERRLVVPVLNGAMLIPRQSYPHRPDIVSTDVARLYFIGDTTRGEGCSGDIAFSSAIKLAALLQGRE
jgi:phytoene dehydrogenase-like protein